MNPFKPFGAVSGGTGGAAAATASSAAGTAGAGDMTATSPPPAASGAAFHSPFASLVPTPASAASASVSGAHAAARPSNAASTPTPFAMLPSPTNIGGGGSSAAISGPSSAAASAFPSPFASLSSSPRSAGRPLLGGATGGTGGGGSSGASALSVVSAFPPPSFGGGTGSSARSDAGAVAPSVSLGFPAPTFGGASGGGGGGSNTGSSSPVSGFPPPFPSGPVPVAGSVLLASGLRSSASHPHSFPVSQMGSFPPSRASSFPGSVSASMANSQSTSPLPRGYDGVQQTHGTAAAAFAAGGKSSSAVFASPFGAGGANLSPFPAAPSSAGPMSSPSPTFSSRSGPTGSSGPGPMSLSLPSSHQPSPVPSPRIFAAAGTVAGGAMAGPPGSMQPSGQHYSPMLFPKGAQSQSLAQQAPHSRSMVTVPSARPIVPISIGMPSAAAAAAGPLSSLHAAAAASPQLALSPAAAAALPARIPPFPASLRAPAQSCSPIGRLLAPAAPAGAATVTATTTAAALQPFVAPSPFSVQLNGAETNKTSLRGADADAAAFAALVDSLSFSLSSLLLEASRQSVEPLEPFDFNSAPSPDDIATARLQKASVANRPLAAEVAAPAIEHKKGGKSGRKARGVAADGGAEEEDGEGGFFHAGPRISRAAVGASVQLSSGSVGSSGSSATTGVLADSSSILRSRLFLELCKRVQSQKRPLLEELYRDAQVAALLLQHLVRQPRDREQAKNRADDSKDKAHEGGAASASSSSSSSSSAAASASGETSNRLATAEEPIPVKPTAAHSSVASITALAATVPQLAALQSSMRAARLAAAESTLRLAGPAMGDSLRLLYQRKLAAFGAGRSLSALSNPSDAPSELATPTAALSWLPSLAQLRMLVVGAPSAGTSTLLANLLYQTGRLPFSIVKPRGAPPDYWEMFNGQQTQAGATATSSSSSSTPAPSSLPGACAAFIAAHPKLHDLNVRRYNYRHYCHALYTDRYRIEVMHSNTAHMHSPSLLLPPLAASAPSSSSGKQRSAPSTSSSSSAPLTPQQTNLQVLAALQSDFVLLVVDGSSGSAFAPSPAMQHQLLVAAMVGVRTVVVCVTKMDAGGGSGGGGGGGSASGSGAWSKKKFEAVLAAVISSFLKPLGFASANILSIPVSGLTGENLVSRSAAELSTWYSGPTLLGQLDRVAMPLGRQVESVADRRVVAMVTEAPSITRNMLNEDVVDAVNVRVQVLSGLLVHAEPLAFVAASVPAASPSAARSSFLPLGPVHLAQVQREVREDARDIAVYEDDTAEEDARGGDSAAASAAAATAAAHASALAKAKAASDGRKLTNAEKKQVIADAKKEHARKAAKEKQAAHGKHAKWEDEAAKWIALEAEAEAEEAAEAEASASAAATAAAAAAARLASSRSAQPPAPVVSLALHPAPCLSPGDVGTVSLRTMVPPAPNNEDDLSTLLTGRNMSELVASNSALVLHSLAKQMRAGDMLVYPADASAPEGARFVTAFKAEVLALPTWPSDMHIGTGQAVTMLPLRGALPSPATVSYATPSSLLALLVGPPPARQMPLGSVPVVIDRLVSILNKSNRAVARKKPDYLAGPLVPAASGTPASASAAASAPDLSIVEFSCRPTVLDTFAGGDARLGSFLIVHQETVIAVATVTHIMAYCQ